MESAPIGDTIRLAHWTLNLYSSSQKPLSADPENSSVAATLLLLKSEC